MAVVRKVLPATANGRMIAPELASGIDPDWAIATVVFCVDAIGRAGDNSELVHAAHTAHRTPHIHVRVAARGSAELAPDDERLVLTNQVYFPDALTAQIFESQSPYKERGPSPFTNLNDRIIYDSGGTDGGFLSLLQFVLYGLGTTVWVEK